MRSPPDTVGKSRFLTGSLIIGNTEYGYPYRFLSPRDEPYTFNYLFTSSRPGGGTWVAADFSDLRVRLSSTLPRGGVQITQVYLEVTYTAPKTPLACAIEENTPIDLRLTVAAGTAELFSRADSSEQFSSCGAIGTSSRGGNNSDFVISHLAGSFTSLALSTGGTERFRYTFNPAHIAETLSEPATSIWTGTVADQSGSSRKATYAFSRTYLNNTRVTLGSLTLTTLTSQTTIADLVASQLGPFDFLDDFNISGEVGGNFPFKSLLEDAARDSNIKVSTLWLILAGTVAYIASLAATKATHQPMAGFVIVALLLVMATAANLFSPLYGFLGVVCYIGMGAWSRLFEIGEI